MTESNADVPEGAGGFELTDAEVAALRAAGRWARLVGVTGSIGLALLALLTIDTIARKPQALRFLVLVQGVPSVAATVLEAIGCIVAVALVWGYGRGVAAFFVRGDTELWPAFRRLRHFFIVWTCVVAVSVALGIFAQVTSRPLPGI